MDKLRIISRNSQLALKQSELVKAEINKLYPDLLVEIKGITTKGDKILDKSLDKIGGKGLFIKELQQKLLNNEADVAVHSLKDVPVTQMPDFITVAILKRENPSDCFISNQFNNLSEVPERGVIGTSSARRIALLKKYYPHLSYKLLRGNLQTRLNKLDSGEFDGIILASAGLIRLGLEYRIKEYLNVNEFIPAIGQGAIALEVLSPRLDLMLLLGRLDDNDTYVATESEREVGKILGADCSVPVGVHASYTSENVLTLSAFIANNSNNKFISTVVSGSSANYLSLSLNIVHNFKKMGVTNMLGRECTPIVQIDVAGTVE